MLLSGLAAYSIMLARCVVQPDEIPLRMKTDKTEWGSITLSESNACMAYAKRGYEPYPLFHSVICLARSMMRFAPPT